MVLNENSSFRLLLPPLQDFGTRECLARHQSCFEPGARGLGRYRAERVSEGHPGAPGQASLARVPSGLFPIANAAGKIDPRVRDVHSVYYHLWQHKLLRVAAELQRAFPQLYDEE